MDYLFHWPHWSWTLATHIHSCVPFACYHVVLQHHGHAAPAAWWEQEIGGEIGGDDIIGQKAGCRTYQDWWQWQWFNKPNRGFKFGSKLFGVWAANIVFRLHPRVDSSQNWACSRGVIHGKCSRNEWRWTEYQRLFGYNLSQQRRYRYPMSWTKPIC